MNEEIKVSVIIPVYNVEKYISRCLDSVINQTLKQIEILVINDGTKDNSFEICKQYALKDSRIKLFSKENEGLGLTRNYGIKRAKGEYIAFLDSDDFIDLDFYEKLYNDAKKNNTDASFTNIKLYTETGEIIQKDVMPFKSNVVSSKKFMYNLLHVEDKKEYGKNYMGMSVWRSIYKKEILDKNNIIFESERKFISEDIIFNIDFCMASKKISFIDNTYYYYCINGNSLTTTYKKDRFEKDIILYKELIRRLKSYNEYNNVKKGLSNYFLGYVRGAIKQEVIHKSNDKKLVLNRIKEIVNNKYVIDALKDKEYEELQREIYDTLMKLKLVNCIYLVTKIKS